MNKHPIASSIHNCVTLPSLITYAFITHRPSLITPYLIPNNFVALPPSIATFSASLRLVVLST